MLNLGFGLNVTVRLRIQFSVRVRFKVMFVKFRTRQIQVLGLVELVI